MNFFQKITEYIRVHSVAILSTLAVVQNAHLLKGAAGSGLNVLVNIVAAMAGT